MAAAQRPRDEPPGQPKLVSHESQTPGWPGRLHRVVRRLGLLTRFVGRCVHTGNDGFAGIHTGAHGMGWHMPGCDSLTGGAGGESCRVRLGFASRGVRAKRQFAHLCHSYLSVSLRPSPDCLNRSARTTILRTFSFKDREDSFGLLRRQEREPPMIARVALHGSIRRGLWSCSAFHS